MAYQSPLISIPKKTTSDVDWTNPIRQIIAHSYGENPDTYSEECLILQRCRQDAVRGAGSDQTARDLLYKYFGQLELLELRFAEIKVSFPWNDAFTSKLTTQTSLAFEKASIIHLLSSVLSSLASSSSRADPEGLKRAYYNSRAAAGMLTYINENFLHAPSTDLSREVVHLLIGITLAQATEVFTEKLVDEKKAPGLVCRTANQVAGMYAGLVDEVKEFQGKGILDRNWLYVLQIKAKLFASIAQYYRSTADAAGGKHGAAVVRMTMASTFAQDAQRQASSFTYTFVSSATQSLPSDAANSLAEITKAHAALCAENKVQATKDNDLIYHDILPSEASLPAIDKLPPATPITIQEVYGNAEVSKLIGPDIFIRLVPLAVHESASVYSEEKAKLVRGENERVDISEGEIRAALEHLGLPGLIGRWRKIMDDDDGGDEVELGSNVRRLASEIQNGGNVDALLRELEGEREKCDRELRELSGLLDTESRECERMRAKYSPNFTQSPSGSQTAHFRSTISSNLSSLSAAASSDSRIATLWQSIQSDVNLLASGEDALQRTARQIAAGTQPAPQISKEVSLLDLEDDVGPSKSGLEEREREDLGKACEDAQERLDRLGKIRRERDEVLKDLKEKVQNDDVSSLLLLNRRSQNVEPQLFASELEKFRPYQSRIAAAIQVSGSLLQELEMLVKQVEKGKGVKERQRGQKDRGKRMKEWEKKLERSGEGYGEVRSGVGKGLSYYESLGVVIADLRREIRAFVTSRENERNRLVSEIEMRQRIAGSSPPPPPVSRGLETQLSGLSLSGGYSGSAAPTPPRPAQSYSALPPPPPQSSTPSYAPPPPAQQAPPAKSPSPYDFSSFPSLPSAFSSAPSPPAQAYPSAPSRPEPSAQRQSSYGSGYGYPSPTNPYPPPPPPSNPYPPPPPRPQTQTQQYPSYNPPPAQPSYPAPPNPYSAAPPPRPGQPFYPPPPSQNYSASPPPQQPQYPSYQPPTQSQPSQSYQYPTQPPPPPPQPSYGYQPPSSQQQPQQPPSQGYPQAPQTGYQYR